MRGQTFTMLLFLFFVLTFTAYLDSPYSFINKNYAYMTNESPSAQVVNLTPPIGIGVLEEKLESVKKENGYIVETYQEYEIYYDQEGNIVKEEPTSRTETLKYWAKNEKERK